MSTASAPWLPYRSTADQLGEAVRAALAMSTGTDAKLGKVAACDPERLLAESVFPLQAYVVSYESPLRDVAIVLTSHKDDVARPLVETIASAIVEGAASPDDPEAVPSDAAFTIAEPVALDDMPTALEQCDALYLEPAATIELPTGELKLVIGSGLLEAAHALATGAADAMQLGPQALLGETGSSMPSIDELDASLAAEQQAAATSSTATAPQGPTPESSARWAQLLSGVEVEVVAELGQAQLALSEITSLAPERVLTLEQAVDEPVAVLVNGMRYATARLVVVDGEYGIEIVEIVNHDALASSLVA